ncbi:MAG: NifB/NifX family molybdenum-iron cluster-binding protein [Candidatus Thiodiazotropha taylori]|nr:nitrogen fixation protein NifX [Candidatus Thiodiazotropha sp. (ex Lucina pensylvanica)]MCG7876223.1 NifB/NifX family molybdenum-iron cluster-binding protein [Candidatus Thiodiazotropha taylori]MCG8025158.1 NifB/NifX family molybdenum-iron cluster-binding protein [Candidatus Thiodiazotropha endolucinida]MCG7882229.1 NifB/NifX family molybdenum-iron cluster-binding protein [Candidatus Thiodiazotropha taylori]MCG7885734.1 NifB/NifX family molybdenum-iron cluster-binding protein [Candidatus Thi
MTLQRRLQLVGCNTEEQWMTTALKVAFATSDMKHVDQHFGAAQSFAIYAVDQEKVCFVEANEFGVLAMDGNEDKLAAKIAALDGCIAVYSQAVGASAIQQLKAQGIQPVKVSPGSEIRELLENLQEELRQGPGSWLAKAIASTMPVDPARFDKMEEEGWEE